MIIKKLGSVLTHNQLFFILLIAFIFLRIFVAYDSVLLGSDHLKFMELSIRFPEHTLANNQLYLHHSPIYPYTLHLLDVIFQNTYVSSVILSLLASIFAFIFFYKLLMLLTNNFQITFLTLFLFTVSVELITASHEPLRESFTTMLLVMSIYFYLKGVKEGKLKSIILAALFGGITAFTTDHVIFLFPAFGLIYILFNKRKIDLSKLKFYNLHYALLPVVVMLLIYGSWFGIKAYQYSNFEYYPSGYEGTPVKTEGFGITHLFDPHNFEDYTTKGGLAVNVKNIAYNMGYIFNMEPFSIPRGVNFTTMGFLLKPIHLVYMAIIYLPLAILTALGVFYSVYNTFKNKVNQKFYHNSGLFMLLMFILFASPMFYGAASPRYIYPSYLFLFFFAATGIVYGLSKVNLGAISKKIPIYLTIFIILLIPVWAAYNNHIITYSKVVYGAQNTADFINSNLSKKDVIMSQPGYAYKIIYLTDNKVVGLYPQHEKLYDVINYYDVDYIVAGRYYTKDAYHLARETAEYIQKNPEKYELIATISEDYSDFFLDVDKASSDEVYIYKVLD
jgi:hypothetical protein